VKKILEAEKYNLMNYLKSCVMTAGKRRFKSLLACKDFYRITEKTKLEIRFKRWKDVEIVSDLEARRKLSALFNVFLAWYSNATGMTL
jgi:hypothetical protein